MNSILIGLVTFILGAPQPPGDAETSLDVPRFRYGYVMKDNSVLLEIPNINNNHEYLLSLSRVMYDTTSPPLERGQYRLMEQAPEGIYVDDRIGERYLILAEGRLLYATLDGFAVTKSPFWGHIPGGHLKLENENIELPRYGRMDYEFFCPRVLIFKVSEEAPMISGIQKIESLDFHEEIPRPVRDFKIEIEPFIPYSAVLECYPQYYRFVGGDERYIVSRQCRYQTYSTASRYFIATRRQNDDFLFEEISPADFQKPPAIRFVSTFSIQNRVYFFVELLWYESECMGVYTLEDGTLQQVSKSNLFGV